MSSGLCGDILIQIQGGLDQLSLMNLEYGGLMNSFLTSKVFLSFLMLVFGDIEILWFFRTSSSPHL